MNFKQQNQGLLNGPLNFFKNDKIKNILSLLLLCSLSFQLAGCGKGGDGLKCQDDQGTEIECSGHDERPDDHRPYPNDDNDDGGDDGDDGSGDGDDGSVVYEEILNNEEVKENISLGEFRPGDQLHFTISGVEEYPQFTGNFLKTYDSSWEEQVCIPGDFPSLNRNKQCFWFPKGGKCHHRFNNQKENGKKEIVFSDDIGQLQLKLKIGDLVYPLGVIEENNETELKTRFYLNDSITLEPVNVELIVERFKETNHQVGFHGFAGCDGLGKRGFKTKGSTSSKIVKVRKLHTFNISVLASYKEEDNKE